MSGKHALLARPEQLQARKFVTPIKPTIPSKMILVVFPVYGQEQRIRIGIYRRCQLANGRRRSGRDHPVDVPKDIVCNVGWHREYEDLREPVSYPEPRCERELGIVGFRKNLRAKPTMLTDALNKP